MCGDLFIALRLCTLAHSLLAERRRHESPIMEMQNVHMQAMDMMLALFAGGAG